MDGTNDEKRHGAESMEKGDGETMKWRYENRRSEGMTERRDERTTGTMARIIAFDRYTADD